MLAFVFQLCFAPKNSGYDKVFSMPKRTFQPKKRQRSKEHGFMKRMVSRGGRKVLARRRTKGRARLSH